MKLWREPMPQHTCPLCGSQDLTLLFGGKRPSELKPFLVTTNEFGNFDDLFKCRECGFVAQFLGAEELEPAYQDSIDAEYMQEEKGRAKTAGRILEGIEKYVGPGRLLDVGCYSGILLAEARARGWEVEGVELATWAVETARTRFGLDIFHGTLDDAKFPEAHFDVVTLIDVIEHVPKFMELLARVNALLKPDGAIYVSTPNADSPLAKWMGRRWWSYRLEHVSLFGRATLSRALKESGFEVAAQWTRGRDFTIDYWAGKWMSTSSLGKQVRPIFNRVVPGERIVYVDFFDQIDMLARKT